MASPPPGTLLPPRRGKGAQSCDHTGVRLEGAGEMGTKQPKSGWISTFLEDVNAALRLSHGHGGMSASAMISGVDTGCTTRRG